ncbi:MAG: hypothetical protein LBT01_05845 [Spirochaetaceae bacterium]|jgi:hypothetical protein|nr:hypothetical protein [Spirochaetaceae bacterium]
MSRKTLLRRHAAFSVFKIFSYLALWKAALTCLFLVLKNFFFLQYKTALFSGKIPLSDADNPLDEAIPFKPDWVAVYMDFATFWIRTQGFLLETFGKTAHPYVKDFIFSMGRLYQTAAEVYRLNVSTTKRPAYYGNFHFIVIHLIDPHLMCIPSLHVMVMIRTYTKFRAMLGALGADAQFAAEIEAARKHAIAITESILYVKQHSVNCIPAAMYAMTRFDSKLFPPEEGARFVDALFQDGADGISSEKSIEIKTCIAALYKQFLDEGEQAADWKAPLLAFLQTRRHRRFQPSVQSDNGGLTR